MNKLLTKYLNINLIYLYLLNVSLYILSIFIEYKYIFTIEYYKKYLGPIYHSEKDFQDMLSTVNKEEIYNYLWCPIHIGLMIFIISLCIFIGLNAFNYYIKWSNCIKATLQAIIIFSVNNILVVTLKAIGLISYTPGTVNDVYFFQSLGSFFINKGYPDFVYDFLEKINLVEFVFCLLLSFTVNSFMKLKYTKSLYIITLIYLLGTIIYICITRFISHLI